MPNIPNHGCETLTKELPRRENSHSLTENSEKGKESNSTKKQERQRNILKPSRKAVTTLNSGDVHHKQHLCAYRPWQYFYFRKIITLYSVRKRNCGHDCNNMHHVHVKFYSKTIIGKGCSRHKVLKNQNSLIQCLRYHTHNRFQFIF